jgi:hypothetical protein
MKEYSSLVQTILEQCFHEQGVTPLHISEVDWSSDGSALWESLQYQEYLSANDFLSSGIAANRFFALELFVEDYKLLEDFIRNTFGTNRFGKNEARKVLAANFSITLDKNGPFLFVALRLFCEGNPWPERAYSLFVHKVLEECFQQANITPLLISRVEKIGGLGVDRFQEHKEYCEANNFVRRQAGSEHSFSLELLIADTKPLEYFVTKAFESAKGVCDLQGLKIRSCSHAVTTQWDKDEKSQLHVRLVFYIPGDSKPSLKG